MGKLLARVFFAISIASLITPAQATGPTAAETDAAALCRLDPPPAPGSKALEEDLQTLHSLQQLRTPEQCEIARREKKVSLRAWFGPETGVLNEAEIRRAMPIALQVAAAAGAATAICKRHFRRARPYAFDRTLQPCIELPGRDDLSYPSGHAAVSSAVAHVLARMFPAKAAVILRQGNQIGDNRALGGVHFPSDVRAGRELSRDVLRRFGIDVD